MVSYLVRRLARLVVSLAIVSAITFMLLQLAPGSFADISRLSANSTGLATSQTSEAAAQLTSRYGDEVPAWLQYLKFMKGAVTWDFGPSYQYPQLTVQEIIGRAFPVSLTLALSATVLALLIAVPLGVFAAVRKNSVWDYGSMFTVTIAHAFPGYLAAIGLVLIFASWLHLLPTTGWSGPQNMIMPTLALAVGPIGVLARYVRSSMLETLREEYVVAAHAKGGSPRTVIVRHALRNSLMPLVTVVGPMLASLATGTIFIESIFGIPGLGLYFANAAKSRDMPLLMAATLFFAIILMVMNLLVDLTYGFLDPRTRTELQSSGRRSKRRARSARVSSTSTGSGPPGSGDTPSMVSVAGQGASS